MIHAAITDYRTYHHGSTGHVINADITDYHTCHCERTGYATNAAIAGTTCKHGPETDLCYTGYPRRICFRLGAWKAKAEQSKMTPIPPEVR